MIVRRIGVPSTARVAGFAGAALGFLVGFFVSFFSLLGLAQGLAFTPAGGLLIFVGLMFGSGAIVLLPLVCGTMCLVVGGLSAFVYNLAVQAIGGLEIELVPDTTPGPVAGHPAAPSAPAS